MVLDICGQRHDTMLKQPPIILLVVASSFSPLAMTACVPALPAIGEEFGLPISTVQFAISIYLLGLALAQPVHGVLADRYGRRPVFLWGFGVFALASLACALTTTMWWFIAFRLVQAAGIATATVVTRAMFRDAFDIDDSARYTAYLAGGMGVATMLAPALSGYLIETSGWRMSFFVITGLALVVLIRLLLMLPETKRQETAAENALRKIAADFTHLIKSGLFWGYTLIFGFVNAAFFTFLTSAPLYFADHLFTGPALFGIYMGSMAFAYICGALIGSRVIRLYGSERTLQLGLCGAFSSVGLILLTLWCFPVSVLTIVLPLLFLFASTGLVNPTSMAGAVAHHPDKAGTASGISNSIAMTLGALAAVTSAQVYDGNIQSLYLPLVVSIGLSVLAYLLLVGRQINLKSKATTITPSEKS